MVTVGRRGGSGVGRTSILSGGRRGLQEVSAAEEGHVGVGTQGARGQPQDNTQTGLIVKGF